MFRGRRLLIVLSFVLVISLTGNGVLAWLVRQQYRRELPAAKNCQVVNRGKSHDTSGQLLLRLQRDVLALKPDVVFLEVGVNDLKSIGALPDEERQIIERLKANRNEIIDRLTAANIDVIVSTIFPFGDVTFDRLPIWSDKSLSGREEINNEIRAMKRPRVTVFDADPIFSVNGRMKPDFQLDTAFE
jgi:lysophospholipase L1-like esterase